MVNLRNNVRSLTTPFDLHETLLDILIPARLEQRTFSARKLTSTDEPVLPRAHSLFSPIPDYRTCALAGIPEHWCMCHSSISVPLDDPSLVKITAFLLSQLNGILITYPQCVNYESLKVIGAKSWSNEATNGNKTGKKTSKLPLTDFTLTVEASPGQAVFEASIRLEPGQSKNMKLLGSVSRLNAYGKTSSCVDDAKMRLYCYCQSFL